VLGPRAGGGLTLGPAKAARALLRPRPIVASGSSPRARVAHLRATNFVEWSRDLKGLDVKLASALHITEPTP